jgi:hypothetical protein
VVAHLLLLPALGGQPLLKRLDLTLQAVGCRVRIRCADTAIAALVRAAYGALECDADHADATYVASRCAPAGYWLHRAGREAVVAADDGAFLMLLETELSVELQRRRPDLFFLHAAALAHEGGAVLLVGASGAGKSTAAWGLAHVGFRYLSDELAPLDPGTLEVSPYPRALCLKADPPASHPVPGRTLRTPRSLHVPPEELPGGVGTGPAPLHAIFFVQHRATAPWPSVEPVTKGEAAARLLAHSLNALAHRDAGLDAASRIASEVPAFRLRSAWLGPTAALVKAGLTGTALTAAG